MAWVKKRTTTKGEVRWLAVYRTGLPDRPEHSKTFHTKREAERWAAEREQEVHNGTYVPPDRQAITVAEWIERVMAGYAPASVNTKRARRKQLAPWVKHLGHVRVMDVRPSDVRRVMAEVGDGYSVSTRRGILGGFRWVMREAVADRLITVSPAADVKVTGTAGRREWVPSIEEVWELYLHLPGWAKPAVLLGAFAGLRAGEIAGLRVVDIDPVRNTVTPKYQPGGHTLKTPSSYGSVPMAEGHIAELIAHAATHGHPNVLVTTNGRPWESDTFAQAIRLTRAAGAPIPEEFTPHVLRHFAGSHLTAQGVPIYEVQTFMRHANATVTLKTYGHLMDKGHTLTRAALARTDSLRTLGH